MKIQIEDFKWQLVVCVRELPSQECWLCETRFYLRLRFQRFPKGVMFINETLANGTIEVYYWKPLAYTTAFLLYLFMVVSISLNCLSIVCIVYARAYRTSPINILVINLAISDIIYSLNAPVLVSHIIGKDYEYSLFTCRLFFLFDQLAMMVRTLCPSFNHLLIHKCHFQGQYLHNCRSHCRTLYLSQSQPSHKLQN